MDDVIVVGIIIIVVLMASTLAVLVKIHNTLIVMAQNQVLSDDQIKIDTATTAKTLLDADAQRQTRDPNSGEDVVNTRIKE